jgi:magnesium chelatase family protein
MTREAWSLLGEAFRKEGLSGRGYVRVMALARTIADIDLREMVGVDHVAEALSLRLDYRRLGVL